MRKRKARSLSSALRGGAAETGGLSDDLSSLQQSDQRNRREQRECNGESSGFESGSEGVGLGHLVSLEC